MSTFLSITKIQQKPEKSKSSLSVMVVPVLWFLLLLRSSRLLGVKVDGDGVLDMHPMPWWNAESPQSPLRTMRGFNS